MSLRERGSKGAGEEPGPEPNGSLPSSSTASYDPTVFQRPHPDDRGAADGTPRKKGDGKAKSKDKAQGKTKDGKGKAVGRCGNCDAEGAKMKCSQCGTEVYCDEKCQRVSGQREKSDPPCCWVTSLRCYQVHRTDSSAARHFLHVSSDTRLKVCQHRSQCAPKTR